MALPEDNSRFDDAVREEAVAWLSRLRNGENSNDHEAFEDWYSADPRHADIYDDVLANWDRMAVFAETVQQGRGAQSKSARKPQHAQLFGLAAVLVLLVIGLAFYIVRDAPWSQPDSKPIVMASKTGEIRSIRLPDGSRIILDTDSSISFAFTGTSRSLELQQGRARFEVAHDKTRPFIVSAGGVHVIAHGTVFDIDLGSRQPIVALLRGSIEIRRKAENGAGQFLRAGESLVVGSSGASRNVSAFSETASRWPTGMLSFQDAPLAEVAAAANRYAVNTILLVPPEIGSLRFTGTVAASDTERLVHLLAETFHLEVSRDGEGRFVLKQPVKK